jgi:hypothetical protein
VERKTTGIRCTDAPPIAVDLSTGKQSGRIFTQEDGSWLHPGKVSDLFERLVAAAGLPPVRLHDVRHGAATLMLSAGLDIKVVSGIEPFAHGHFGVEALADSEAATGLHEALRQTSRVSAVFTAIDKPFLDEERGKVRINRVWHPYGNPEVSQPLWDAGLLLEELLDSEMERSAPRAPF